MNYAQTRKYDVANGEGIRTTLFVSGCTHNCKSCFNREYADFNYGNEWTKEVEDNFIEMCKDENVTGVSILGGEPLQQYLWTMAGLVLRIKKEVNKSIWMWTGYTYETIPNAYREFVLPYIDVLVDGKFIESQKDLRLKFRGSKNQNIIDVQQSLKEGKVVLYES